MRKTRAIVERHPLISFFVLAYGITWPVIPLVSVSPLMGLPALFGPAFAAIIVVVITQGKTGLKDLLSRLVRWRVGARWYAIALGLPTVLALTTAGVQLLLGGPAAIQFGGLSVLNIVLFVFVVGEELGWRGYALPRLLATKTALVASLILGVLWGAWHLPTFFVPGAPQYGLPFSAFVILTVAYSILFTWIYIHTRGSVLISTLLHGSINFSQGFFLGGMDPAREYWLLVAVYGAAALAVALMFGPNLTRKTSIQATKTATAGSQPQSGSRSTPRR
jgi:uncharacterized protein